MQGLARIPETLVIAMEFIVMPTPSTQQVALGDLQRTIFQLHPDLKVGLVYPKSHSAFTSPSLCLSRGLAGTEVSLQHPSGMPSVQMFRDFVSTVVKVLWSPEVPSRSPARAPSEA